MEDSAHHQLPPLGNGRPAAVPSPSGERPQWLDTFLRTFGDDSDSRWGSRFMRLSSDTMMVCDENLEIVFHNRAFVKAIGHDAGTFVGESFLDFFPLVDRADAEKAFNSLMGGRAGGIRIDCSLLTVRGERRFVARVARSRRSSDGFYLYLVIREEAQKSAETKKIRSTDAKSLFSGFPVAAFRTDRRLRIVDAAGELWESFGATDESVIGGDLTGSGSMPLPQFLLDIDYCDTMAGLTLQSDFTWKDESFVITLEPFIDSHLKVMGTVGMIRKTKQVASMRDAEHLKFPKPEDYTQSLKAPGKTGGLKSDPRSIAHDPTKPVEGMRRVELTRPETETDAALQEPTQPVGKMRKVELTMPEDSEVDPSSDDEITKIRSSIRPRRLSPGDMVASDRTPTEPVALAN